MKTNLRFDTILSNFFNETQSICRISDIFRCNGVINYKGDYIQFDSPQTVSFIPKDKIDLYEKSNDRVKYSVNIKIGRFVLKFLKKDILDKYCNQSDIEFFVNFYKSYFTRDESKLKVIEGDEILDYYREENYQTVCGNTQGTLWKSCMRQSNRNKFMKLYAINKDKVKMLVLFSDENKVKARALLWQDCIDKNTKNSYKVMDRIYTINDYDVNFLKDWAVKNGYIHKYEQSANNEMLFIKDDTIVELNLSVRLENWLSIYPYLDTFKFYDMNGSTLSNSSRNKYQYVLVQSDGSLEKEEECEDNDGDMITLDF